jgi:hypothetical protein
MWKTFAALPASVMFSDMFKTPSKQTSTLTQAMTKTTNKAVAKLRLSSVPLFLPCPFPLSEG